MKTATLAMLPLCLVAACSDFPRDSAGTLERARNGRFMVGWSDAAQADLKLHALVRHLGERIGSEPISVTGGTEPLLARLEAGELDLVVGRFDRKSPWERRVTFSQPVSTASAAVEGKAAVRKGEHAWAMEVDRAAKAVEKARP